MLHDDSPMPFGKIATLTAHIRWMIRADMSDIMEIERHSFEESWTEDGFIRCLRQRNCIGMVAEVGEKIAGFMIYELYKSRLLVLNLAVHEDYRRHGIGRQMNDRLKSKLSCQRTRIELKVSERNLDAQLFFRSVGYRAVSVLRNHFDNPVEDAYEMECLYESLHGV